MKFVTASERGAMYRCRRVGLLPVQLELPRAYLLALPWVEDGLLEPPCMYRPPLFSRYRGWQRATLDWARYDAALHRAFKRRVGLAGPHWRELRLPGYSLAQIARAAGIPLGSIHTWRADGGEW